MLHLRLEASHRIFCTADCILDAIFYVRFPQISPSSTVTLAISALCPGMGSPDDEIYDILFDAQVPLKESQMLSKARIIL